MDSYLTIEHDSIGVFKDRKSKFIAIAKPIRNENDVKHVISEIKSEYSDATHHCYAYRFIDKNLQIIEHWSDDGEPANSAGIQIYYAIKKFDLLNLLVVVVRYYGGVKLGVPGLINAYKCSTLEALENAHKIEKKLTKYFSISFTYEQMSKVMTCLKRNKAEISKQNLDVECYIEADIHLPKYEIIEEELKNINVKINELN
ncbi:MAG TPA: YigZ family protein [Bacteroidales bacterium]|jgi:uncharacterized YigZ family protein|nr:YigZ family protein [Bacteroidales bacterium]HOU97670.1 YigZ family protein [Bacteroidales bacterium]